MIINFAPEDSEDITTMSGVLSKKSTWKSIGITVGLRVGSIGLGIFYFVTKLFLYETIIFK